MLLPSDGAHIPVINVGTRKYQIPDFIFFAVAGARRWLHGEERWLHGRSWVTRRGRWHSVADLDQKWKLQPLQWLSGEQRMVRAEWQLAEELEGKEWRGWKRRKRLMVGGKLEKGTKRERGLWVTCKSESLKTLSMNAPISPYFMVTFAPILAHSSTPVDFGDGIMSQCGS